MALPDALDLPRPFGEYTLLKRIAVGGMAEIYRAKTRAATGDERLVAIKVIHPRLSEDSRFVQMLVEEARISVLLSHPNVAHCFDLGCIDGVYFLVMEYIEGADAFRIARKAAEVAVALPVDVCLFIAAEVVAGLGHAHSKTDAAGRPLQIVHRDVSPQNILLGLRGEVKLIDFGIAKAAMRAGQTQAGVIKGKFHYMSPEQARGGSLDGRSDLFSAAVVLYELLTGNAVYDEDSVPELLDRVREAEIRPPTIHRGDLPGPVTELVMKALARRAEDRFQTAQEMENALRAVLSRLAPNFTARRLAELVAALVGSGSESTPSELPSAGEARSSGAVERHTVALSPMTRGDFRSDPDQSVIMAAPSESAGGHRSSPGRTRELRSPSSAPGSGPKARAGPESRWDEPTVVEEEGSVHRAAAAPSPAAASLGRASPFHAPLEDEAEPTVRAQRPSGEMLMPLDSRAATEREPRPERLSSRDRSSVSEGAVADALPSPSSSFDVDTEQMLQKPGDTVDNAPTIPRFTAADLQSSVAPPSHTIPSSAPRLGQMGSNRSGRRASGRVVAAFVVFVLVAGLAAAGSLWLLWRG